LFLDLINTIHSSIRLRREEFNTTDTHLLFVVMFISGDSMELTFTGVVHRQYSWNEVLSNVYELSDEEFEFLQNVPLAKFKNT
jgi:hypothetical protein